MCSNRNVILFRMNSEWKREREEENREREREEEKRGKRKTLEVLDIPNC